MPSVRPIQASVRVLSHLVVLLTSSFACASEINESIRFLPTQVRRIDSIPAESQLLLHQKLDGASIFVEKSLSMSLFSFNDSFSRNWHWTPKSNNIRFPVLYGIRIDDDGMGGSCLLTSRDNPYNLYRYSFKMGATTDSAMLNLSKATPHMILDVATNGNLIAIAALSRTISSDTAFTYVIDTTSGRSQVWSVPLPGNGMGLQDARVCLLDSVVLMYWHLHIGGSSYTNHVVVYNTRTGDVVHRLDLTNESSPRIQVRTVMPDASNQIVRLVGVATRNDRPLFGVQNWTIDLRNGSVDSSAEYFSEFLLLSLDDAFVTDKKEMIAVGRVVDIDRISATPIEPSSRGIMIEWDSSGRVKRCMSMQEQRPTRLNTAYIDRQQVFVGGKDVQGLQFVGLVDEGLVTKVQTSNVVHHDPDSHVAWYSVSGGLVLTPSDGAYVEVFRCNEGCLHSRLCLFRDSLRIEGSFRSSVSQSNQ